jgi:hypothetical protein
MFQITSFFFSFSAFTIPGKGSRSRLTSTRHDPPVFTPSRYAEQAQHTLFRCRAAATHECQHALILLVLRRREEEVQAARHAAPFSLLFPSFSLPSSLLFSLDSLLISTTVTFLLSLFFLSSTVTRVQQKAAALACHAIEFWGNRCAGIGPTH